jgi:O-antigen/teichoic acid export membrane protein
MLAGSFALQAVILVISPQISASLAKGDRQRAAFLYNSATCWLVIPSFPIYLTMAVFAPFLLELFGRGFERGESVLVILALATLVNMATGPVQAVLLMSGRSLWNLANTGAAVLINIVLNLVLIPRMGIDGAAIAWAAVIILNNVATLLEVMFFMKLRPFSRPLLVLVGASGFCFGLVGVAVRELFGLSVGSFLGFIAVAGLLYTGFLFANRRELRLAELRDAVRRRMGSPPSESAPV